MAMNWPAPVRNLGHKLNQDLRLNSLQLLILFVILLVPVVLAVASAYQVRYELNANYRQLEDNNQLIDDLASHNQAMGAALQSQDQLINQQQQKIDKLQTSNDDLSSTLAATQTKTKDKKSDKESTCTYSWWCKNPDN